MEPYLASGRRSQASQAFGLIIVKKWFMLQVCKLYTVGHEPLDDRDRLEEAVEAKKKKKYVNKSAPVSPCQLQWVEPPEIKINL